MIAAELSARNRQFDNHVDFPRRHGNGYWASPNGVWQSRWTVLKCRPRAWSRRFSPP